MSALSATSYILVKAINVTVWINQSYFKASSHPWFKLDGKKLRQPSTRGWGQLEKDRGMTWRKGLDKDRQRDRQADRQADKEAHCMN
jgi:hypothetical protein